MAELVLRLKERELKRIPILNTRVTLGRDHGSDLVIDNTAVSRTHAILIYVDDKYRIRDNDSQNGLTVNGAAVKDSVLKYGDVIGIAKFEIELVQTEEEYKLQVGEQLKGKSAKDVVETVDMDSASAASAQQAIAQAMAAKGARAAGEANPEPTVVVATPSARPAEDASRPRTETRPTPTSSPRVSAVATKGDLVSILKKAAIGLVIAIGLIAAGLYFLTH